MRIAQRPWERLSGAAIILVGVLCVYSPQAVADSRCLNAGTTVAANRHVRLFTEGRTVRVYGKLTHARIYFACLRPRGRVLRLKLTKGFQGGTAMTTPRAEYQTVLSPRLTGRYVALRVSYFDELAERVGVWNVATRHNTYHQFLQEGVEPDDLELTSRGALAWMDDGWLTKSDGRGYADLGRADRSRRVCGAELWCEATVTRRGARIFWRQRGIRRSYRLRGSAFAEVPPPIG
jgi:hypothetical protein